MLEKELECLPRILKLQTSPMDFWSRASHAVAEELALWYLWLDTVPFLNTIKKICWLTHFNLSYVDKTYPNFNF